MKNITTKLKKHAVHAGISGVGHYAPPGILTNADLEKMVETSDEWIVTRTGIRERHIAEPSVATSDLCYEAATRALDDAGITAEELDLIIVATVTPDHLFPSTSCILQAKLGATNAAAFDLGAGCTGFVYAMTTAAQFIQSGTYKNVLVVGAEMLSKVTNWEDRSTCVLFGDGAGAAVMQPCEEGMGLLTTYLAADGSVGDLLGVKSGGTRHPLTEEGLRANEHKLHMDGSEVFKIAVRSMESAILKVLEDIGEEPGAVDVLIPHQANLRIIDAVNKKLKLPQERLVVNIDRYGNTSSGSVPIALSEAVTAGRIKEGDLVVMTAFGAGMTWGAVAMRWNRKEA